MSEKREVMPLEGVAIGKMLEETSSGEVWPLLAGAEVVSSRVVRCDLGDVVVVTVADESFTEAADYLLVIRV